VDATSYGAIHASSRLLIGMPDGDIQTGSAN
jgi:hypothetical protein